ncbi:MAG: outer membrane protein [Xanthobacteraceae bacterium]
MKRWLIAGALAFAASGQALAADLPQAGPPPPQAPVAYIPTVAPVYNWGGIYFGVNGGYGFGSSQQSDAAGTSTGTFNTSGFLVGGTIGANFQTDAFVFGIEGDFDGSWMQGTSGTANCVSGGVLSQCETKNSWLSTVRARVGYAADRVLFYGTAGGAFGNIEQGASNAANSSFASASKAGWTAGAGIEAAFADNWTARVEYLFVDLSNATFNTVPATTVKFDASLIRLGVDYKFR